MQVFAHQQLQQQRPRHSLVVDASDEATRPPRLRRKHWLRFNFADIGKRYMYARCLHRMWLAEVAQAKEAVAGIADQHPNPSLSVPVNEGSVKSTRKRSDSTGYITIT